METGFWAIRGSGTGAVATAISVQSTAIASYGGTINATQILNFVVPAVFVQRPQVTSVFKADGVGNNLGVGIFDNGAGAWAMYWIKSVSGSLSAIGPTAGPFTLVPGGSYTLRVVIVGNTHTATLEDGSGVIASMVLVDGSFPANTKVGLREYVEATRPAMIVIGLERF